MECFKGIWIKDATSSQPTLEGQLILLQQDFLSELKFIKEGLFWKLHRHFISLLLYISCKHFYLRIFTGIRSCLQYCVVRSGVYGLQRGVKESSHRFFQRWIFHIIFHISITFI